MPGDKVETISELCLAETILMRVPDGGWIVVIASVGYDSQPPEPPSRMAEVEILEIAVTVVEFIEAARTPSPPPSAIV